MGIPASRKLSRWQKITVILLIVFGLLLTLGFGLRTLRSFKKARQIENLRPGERNIQLIRGWMTIDYIARIYEVPEEVLFKGLGIEAQPELSHASLRDLGRKYYPAQPEQALRRIQQAIIDYYGIPPLPPAAPGSGSEPPQPPDPQGP